MITSTEIEAMTGVWVRVEPVVGPHREGLLRRTAHWRHGFTIALMSPGEISMIDLTNREIAGVEPVPMPEPPDGTVLEALSGDSLYWRDPVLAEDFTRWFEVGVYDALEWADLRLGTVDRRIHVVRWGR